MLNFKLLQKYSKKFSRVIQTIPTLNKTHEIYGNLQEALQMGGLNNFFEQKHKELGPLFYYWFRDEKVLSLGHPKYFYKLNSFNDRPELVMRYRFAIFNRTISTTNTVDRKFKKKYIYNESFQKETLLTRYKEAFERNINIFLTEIFSKPNTKIDVEKEIANFLGSVIIEILYDERNIPREEMSEVYYSFKYAFKDMELDYFGAEFDESKKKEIQENVDITQKFIKKRVDNWYKRDKNVNNKCYLDFFKDETYEQLLDKGKSFFFTGISTATNLLTNFVKILATHPEIQNKMRKEILEKFCEEKIEINSLKVLKYMRACLKETLRFAPPTSSLKKQCTETFDYDDGLHITKGTIVTVPLIILNKDENFWENAKKFDPERFLERPIKFSVIQFIPFGLGDRLCPGKNFAKLVCHYLIANMFRNFRVSHELVFSKISKN